MGSGGIETAMLLDSVSAMDDGIAGLMGLPLDTLSVHERALVLKQIEAIASKLAYLKECVNRYPVKDLSQF